MGTWGEKPYENDSAYDWVNELEGSKDEAFLYETLKKGKSSKILDSPECEEIVAAAALVNSASLEKLKGIPKEAKDWIKKIGFVPNKGLIDISIKSLSVVIEGSELLNLYRESKRDKQWIKCTKPILESLESIDTQLLPERKPKPVSIPRVLYKLVQREDLFSNPEIRKRIKSRLNKLENIDQAISETDNLPPVAFLAKYGLLEEVLFLVDNGAKLKEIPDLLTYACGADRLELVQLILDSGAAITKRYTFVSTPEVLEISPGLMNAATAGTSEIIDALVSAGADLFQVDNNGEGLLHYATRYGNHRVIQHLLDLGLDINLVKNGSNETPAHFCLKEYDSLKLLLENGADPNMEDKWEGTLLDVALIHNASDETIELLRAYGAKKTKDWIEDDRA
mgnify:CR=1 FL=1